MKIKILILLCLTLVISGCTSHYNLTISSDGVDENIDFTIPKSLIPIHTQEEIDNGIEVDDQVTPLIEENQYPFADNYDIIYSKSVTEDEENFNVQLSYSYKPFEYANAAILKRCFDNYSYSYEDGYELVASGKFYCLYADTLEINIKAKNKVIESNADSVNGNIYTWIINSNNKNNVDIKIKMEKGIKSKYLALYIVLGVIILLAIIIFVKFMKNKKKVNEI